MGFLAPSVPSPPGIPIPPPAAHPPTLGANAVAASGAEAKSKAAIGEGMGADGTIATSPQGVQQSANTAKATLLGQ